MTKTFHRRWFRFNQRMTSRRRRLDADFSELAKQTRRWILRWIWRLS